MTLKRYICDGCNRRWREEETNHPFGIYNIMCPVCVIERPFDASSWTPTTDPRILNAPGRSGTVPA